MKHFFLLILIGITIFSACETTHESSAESDNEAQSTAEAFAKALGENDFKTAKKYASEMSVKQLNETENEAKRKITEHFKGVAIDTVKQYATVEYKTADGTKAEMQMEYTANGWKIFLNEELLAGSPLQVAKLFMKALSDADFEEAQKYGTKNTQLLLSMVDGIADLATGETDFDMESDFESIEWGEVEIDGKRATVFYSNGESEETVDLKLVDGEWKVDLKKE